MRSKQLRSGLVIALIGFVAGLNACRTSPDKPSGSSITTFENTPTSDGPQLCAAFRGNGQRIMGIFAATARIVEHYGPIDGVAGGSSGSIASFLYESMWANPNVHDCDGEICHKSVVAERLALLLKSLQRYVALLGETDEANALLTLIPIYKKAKEMGIDGLMQEDRAAAREALLKLFKSPDIKELINPEVIGLLSSSPNPAYHTQEVWNAVKGIGDFDATDNKIFFRPGIINPKAFARKVGRIASFYAAFAPVDQGKMRNFLRSCSAKARGKDWAAIAGLTTAGGTCGQEFDVMAQEFRAKLLTNEDSYPARIDEKIGQHLPAIVPNALLEGEDAASRYIMARKQFLAAQPIDFVMNFDLVKIGYYGRPQDLKLIIENPRGYTDYKSTKAVSLGQTSWEEPLTYSPAEPGIARLLEMSDSRISAAGWYDLHPTQVLRNIGCQNVVYITRSGDEVGYPYLVARQLGLTDAQNKELYDLGNPDSSLSTALQEAQGIWCTDWNAYDPLADMSKYWDHAYNAPFEARSDFFTNAPTPYPNAKPQLNTYGCSPGATP